MDLWRVKLVDDRATCDHIRLNKGELTSDWSTPRKDTGESGREAYGVDRDGTRIELLLTFEVRRPNGKIRVMRTRCAHFVEVVAVDDEALLLLDAAPDNDAAPIAGYVQEETMQWWRSRQACEDHLEAHPRVPLSALEPQLYTPRTGEQVVVADGC